MIRAYQGGDETRIVELWNKACPKEPISLSMFIKRVLVDPNFDAEGLIVYEVGGEILGAMLGVVRKIPLSGTDLEPENGWVTMAVVHPDHHREGIGTAMMERMKAYFRERDRKNVYFSSYAPNYFVPGLDAKRYPAGMDWLQKSGFQRLYTAVAMDKNLVDFCVPDDVSEVETQRLNDGYAFEALTPRYLAQAIEFNDREFNPDWARAIRDAVSRGVSLDQILIARKGEVVCGFCMYGAYDDVGERFGPFGVHPDQRGLGIGKVLLYRCLMEMKSQGLHGAWFLWTGETSPAGRLYQRAGFQVTRRFEVMRLVLD